MKNPALADKMLGRYQTADFYRSLKLGIEGLKKTGSLFTLEREITNYLLASVRKTKYLAFGVEPLLGYFLARENELKLIRLILTSKKMQVKTEDLKERLPYV